MLNLHKIHTTTRQKNSWLTEHIGYTKNRNHKIKNSNLSSIQRKITGFNQPRVFVIFLDVSLIDNKISSHVVLI